MKKVKLLKDWGPNKAGKVLVVDDQRAETLVKGKFAKLVKG